MASTFVGKSGRMYIQGEVLQHHRQDHKLSVFKAECVLTPYTPYSQLSHISDPSHSGPEMNLLSLSLYQSHSTIALFASQPNLQAHVTFECTSIVTKKIAF